MGKFLDETGVSWLIAKIKSVFLTTEDAEAVDLVDVDATPTQNSTNLVESGGVYSAIAGKQDTLVSGVNIKTVNGESIVGSGNANVYGRFKGWWPDLATLKAAHTATAGDSAYVKDTSPATTWSIYIYDSTASSDNYWADSGTDADTSNVQTFASGEEVNEVHIVNDLTTGGEDDVLSAEQGVELQKQLTENDWQEINVTELTSIPMVVASSPTNGVYLWASNRSNNQQISLYRHTRIKCAAGDRFLIIANDNKDCQYAWLTDYTATYNTAAPLVSGTTPYVLTKSKGVFVEAPSGAEFLYLRATVTAVGNTDILPKKVYRMGSYSTEKAVPLSLRGIIMSSSGSVSSSSGAIVRALKVKQGDKVVIYANYTGTASRLFRVGFCQYLPVSGTTCTVLDNYQDYANRITVRNTYTAPSDGYILTSHQFAETYYKDYSFERVLSGDDMAKPLRDEKIVVFGDSILQLTDAYSNNRGFVEYLGEYTHATVVKGSIGGTRLVPRASSDSFSALDISNLIHSWVNDSWTDVDAALTEHSEYTTIVNNLKAIRPSEVTMIVMDGGGNDLSNTNLEFGDATAANIFNENPTNTTLYGAINYIMRDLFTANSYIKVFWVGGLVNFAGADSTTRTEANWVDNRSFTVDGETLTSKEYRERISSQVGKWKVPYIDMSDMCINPVNFGKFFPSDNTHPYTGFYRMAMRVASQIVARMF